MNPGAIEEGGKVAGGIVEALKSSPLLLVLLLFNAAFFVALHFTSSDTRARQSEMVTHLLENQSKMQEMLTRCFPQRSEVIPLPPVRPSVVEQ